MRYKGRLRDALFQLLHAIHSAFDSAYWIDVLDTDSNSPNPFTLMKLAKLSKPQFILLHTTCELGRLKNNKLQIRNTNAWKNLIQASGIDNCELNCCEYKDRPRSYYLRLGPKQHGAFESAKEQYEHKAKTKEMESLTTHVASIRVLLNEIETVAGTAVGSDGATNNVQQETAAGTIAGSDNEGAASNGVEQTNVVPNNNNTDLYDITKLSVKEQQKLG